MNLLRATGRIMMAGALIANGVKSIKDPDAFVAATAPLADRLVPLAQRTLPAAASPYVPEDTRTLVRLGGLASVAGGLSIATGIAPRCGGALAAAGMVPHVLAANPRGASDKKAALGDFLSTLALAGAALVVSQDTRGKPSMMVRAAASKRQIADAASDQLEAGKARGRAAKRELAQAARRAEKRLALLGESVTAR